MEITELLTNVIEHLIAGFPELILVLTTVTYSLKSIKAKTASFPDLLQTTQKENSISYAKTETNIQKILKETTHQLQQEVNHSLVTMGNQLLNYQKELTATKEQSNLLVQQNKLYMDLIAQLVKADPKLVQDGISSALTTKIALTNEELENYPQLLVSDMNILLGALKDAAKVVGQEKFEEMIGKLGYERKEI